MIDYKILLIDSRGQTMRQVIQARDSYSAQRLAEGMFSGYRQIQVMGPCSAVGY